MEIALAAVAGLLVAGGFALFILRRKGSRAKTFEQVVQGDVDDARRTLEEIRKWARGLRNQRECRQAYVLAHDLTVKIESLLQALEAEPDDHQRIGVHLAALKTIRDALQGFVEGMPTFSSDKFREELAKTESFLREMQTAYSEKRVELALDNLIQMRASRAAAGNLVGRGLTADSAQEPTTHNNSEGTVPPERTTQTQ